MKARVKATGEILEVYESCVEDFPWTDEMGDKVWKTEELIFLETTDNTPDYWTRLEHQYVGMAMQALIIDASYAGNEGSKYLVEECIAIAHALVEKLKKK